jgi:hypothetical protein
MPERTVLEPGPICSVADDVGPAIALEFLGSYLDLLPARLERIIGGLQDQNRETSLDAILSLKITSVMNGALDAAATCTTLEVLVGRGRFEQARVEARKLTAAVTTLINNTPALLQQAAAHIGLSPTDGSGASLAA